MKLAFSPHRQGHALVETIFYLNFEPELDEAKLRLLENPFPELSKLLPEHKALKSIQMKVDQSSGQSISESPAGAEYARLRKDGLDDWKLHVDSKHLAIHCLNYTRWDEVWPFAKKALLTMLDRIAKGTSISAIGLKNIDRFDYTGEETSYSLDSLFEPETPYLPSSISGKGPLWHAHSGWFQNIGQDSNLEGDDVNILFQLNISGSRERSPSGSSHYVSIDQNLMLRSEAEDELTIANNNHQHIDNIFAAFHKLNKDFLRTLLTKQMCRRISLGRVV